MLYSIENLINEPVRYLDKASGIWRPARPLWVSWGRWKHAWWVLTGRCDAIWWPENGFPYNPRRDILTEGHIKKNTNDGPRGPRPPAPRSQTITIKGYQPNKSATAPKAPPRTP